MIHSLPIDPDDQIIRIVRSNANLIDRAGETVGVCLAVPDNTHCSIIAHAIVVRVILVVINQINAIGRFEIRCSQPVPDVITGWGQRDRVLLACLLGCAGSERRTVAGLSGVPASTERRGLPKNDEYRERCNSDRGRVSISPSMFLLSHGITRSHRSGPFHSALTASCSARRSRPPRRAVP